jgi:hypothetical protein
LPEACRLQAVDEEEEQNLAPTKPQQYGFAESFDGYFRGVCLSEYLFGGISAARRITEALRIDHTRNAHTRA